MSVFLVSCGGGVSVDNETIDLGDSSLPVGSETPSVDSTPTSTADTVASVEVDVIPPVIAVTGDNPMSLFIGDSYEEFSALATDHIDGEIAVTVSGSVDTNVPGVNVITYHATDNANNTASVNRIVNVLDSVVVHDIDRIAPSIELNGENPMVIFTGDLFQDPSAQASDDIDGVVSVSVSGLVNVDVEGVYLLTYSAMDAAGNIATAARTVIVEDNPITVPNGRIDVYPAPMQVDGVVESSAYRVTIVQNGVEHVSYVNTSVNNNTKNVGSGKPEVLLTDAEREVKFRTDTNHWTSFSFEGPVSVNVEVLRQSSVNGRTFVRPNNRNIATTAAGNTVSFEINEPGNFYLYVEGEDRHPLFLFANPISNNAPDLNANNVFMPEQIRQNPGLLSETAEQVIYFPPGVHVISEPVYGANGVIDTQQTEASKFPTLPSNTSVYIAGGAYVKGLISIHEDVDNVHIRGRGILSGFDYPHENDTWNNHAVHFEGFSRSTNMSVEGITIVDGPKTCLTARSGPIVIDNIKCLSWHANTDGIASGTGSVVKNSFFKVYDDVIKLFHRDILVEDNTIWLQQTGSAFQLSWNLTGAINNSRINNTDIIAVDREAGTVLQTGGTASDYPDGSRANGAINNALINARNLKGAFISDIVFDTVRFDAKPFQLFQFQLKDHRTGFSSGFGDIDNIQLRNVSMIEAPRINNYILDNGIGDITNIVLEDIYVSGAELSPDSILTTETTNLE